MIAPMRAAPWSTTEWQLPKLHWAAAGVDSQGDPTGPIKIGDTWHVFVDCALGWCHATSTDGGISWTDRPALKLGGRGGVGTGSWTQLPNGTFVALYCGGDGCGPGLECLGVATSDDPQLLDVYDHGVQARMPAGLSWFRDPARGFVLNQSRLCTVMGAGAHDCDQGGAKTALLCTPSLDNLHEWSYLGDLTSTFTKPGAVTGGEDDGCNSGGPSCPDFFKLPASDRWALLVMYNNQRSSWFPPARWLVGTFDESTTTFVPESSGLLGGDFDYVPKSGAAAGDENDQRRLMWANIGIAPSRAHAHPGILSFSRELAWEVDGSGDAFLAMRFIPELAALRRPGSDFSTRRRAALPVHDRASPRLARIGDTALIPIRGQQLELRATFPAVAPGESSAYGVAVLTASNGSAFGSSLTETTRIGYDPYWRTLFIDTSASCADASSSAACAPIANGLRALRSYPLDLRPSGGRLELVVYVDGGVLEVCANNRTVLSSFAQTSSNVSDRVGVFGVSAASLPHVVLEAWQLQPTAQVLS